MGASIKIYISYDRKNPEDSSLREKLEGHLWPLVQKGLIDIWSPSPDRVLAGGDLGSEIDAHLTGSNIILLLISNSFISSSDCQKEVERAMERHKAMEASVIPVLLRPVDWEILSYGNITPLPTNKKFIVSWENEDEALFDVERGIQRAIDTAQQNRQTSEGESRAKLYESLIRLNYREQATIFFQFRQKKHQRGVLLIHGAPSYGQGWLLNRLIRQLPGCSTFRVYRFNFQRKANGRSIQDLWIDLAKFVGLKLSFPLNFSTLREEIVSNLFKRWQTASIILMLNNLHEIEEKELGEFLLDFWKPLLNMTNDVQNQSPNNYLLMFLIDNAECVDKWSRIQLTPEVDPTWEPYIPLKLKKLTEFSETVLVEWISNEFETLTDITARDILENSYNGTPEDALDYICGFFDCQWIDLVTYRLTS